MTTATGAYSFSGIAPGGYTLNVSTFGLPYAMITGIPVTVSASGAGVTQDVALVPFATGTATLAGTVRNAQTHQPVSGVSVSLTGDDVVYSGGTTTDGSGHYSIGSLAGGEYSIGLIASGYSVGGGTITVSATGVTTYDVALLPLNAAIAGRVTDPDGAGIAGLFVSASSEYGLLGGGGQTDADGYYTISGLAASDYLVSLGGNFTSWVLTSAPVSTLADETVTLDFQPEPRTTSTVMGAVFGEDYDLALADVCIKLLDAATGAQLATATTESDAVFYLENVVDGDYTLLYEDCDPTRTPQRASTYLGGTSTLADAATFSIDGPADDLQVDDMFLQPKSVAPTKGTITIKVTDAKTGKPIAGANGLYSLDGRHLRVVRADKNGVLTIPDLKFGTYRFLVSAPGYLRVTVVRVTLDATHPSIAATTTLAPPPRYHRQGNHHPNYGHGQP